MLAHTASTLRAAPVSRLRSGGIGLVVLIRSILRYRFFGRTEGLGNRQGVSGGGFGEGAGAELADGGGHAGPHGLVVVLGAQGGHHVALLNAVAEDVGQVGFQPVAGFKLDAVLVEHEQDEQAVILFRIPDFPAVKQRRSRRLGRFLPDARSQSYVDVGAASLVEGAEGVVEGAHGGCAQQVARVTDVGFAQDFGVGNGRQVSGRRIGVRRLAGGQSQQPHGEGQQQVEVTHRIAGLVARLLS